jgi:hypothetical protein
MNPFALVQDDSENYNMIKQGPSVP